MKVLLVDDHPLFVEGLTTLLTAQGVKVVGTASNGLEALQQARALRPDIVLVDLMMPEYDGLEAIRLIKAEMPDIKLAILTMYEESQYLWEAFRCGASGYVLKSTNMDEFVELLRCLERGEVAISHTLASKVMQEFAQQPALTHYTPNTSDSNGNTATITCLTPRQIDILQRVAQGQTYREISSALGIGGRTVQYHMSEILKKLHLRNRAQVIVYAQRMY
jgi:two-component system NarL family response regulator